jgi:hypothetical protein
MGYLMVAFQRSFGPFLSVLWFNRFRLPSVLPYAINYRPKFAISYVCMCSA